MILAAQQPGYLPGLSFFYKMAVADIFILADDVQYTSHGSINRTRIRHAGGVQWLTVPVLTRGRGKQRIHEVEIARDIHWRQKHLKTLWVNYKNAAYFEKYIDFFEGIYHDDWYKLLDLNLAGIEFIREALNLDCKLILSSTLQIPTRGSQKIVDMARRLGCHAYLVERSLQNYLDEARFNSAGIELVYFNYQTPPYHQRFPGFVPGLSVVDLLFNEGDASKSILLRGAN